jgi:hypothetical protein
MSTSVRILGISLNALGAIVLAWRVKGILSALVVAQEADDRNFRLLIAILNGEKQKGPLIVGMDEHVVRKQKRGVWLLVVGFACIAVGNILVGLSWYIEPKVPNA